MKIRDKLNSITDGFAAIVRIQIVLLFESIIEYSKLTSHETSLRIRPDAIEPVSLDQNEDLLGTMGPLCDTPINSSICGIERVSVVTGAPKLICRVNYINCTKNIIQRMLKTSQIGRDDLLYNLKPDSLKWTHQIQLEV